MKERKQGQAKGREEKVLKETLKKTTRQVKEEGRSFIPGKNNQRSTLKTCEEITEAGRSKSNKEGKI